MQKYFVRRFSFTAIFLSAVAFSSVSNVAFGEEISADTIVEKADLVRFPKEGFQVEVAVVSSEAGQETESRKYRILSKDNENTIVITTEPASEKGQILLMKNRDLWVFLPNVSQPVRLSLSQRLTGQVANGDLARANFKGDYTSKLIRTETIDKHEYYVLELTAIDRGVTYNRVMYWVRKSDYQPYKSEFYTISNKLIKTCKYEDFQKLVGQTRPTKMILEDALKQNEKSVLVYSGMQLKELPDKLFTKDYLKKLE